MTESEPKFSMKLTGLNIIAQTNYKGADITQNKCTLCRRHLMAPTHENTNKSIIKCNVSMGKCGHPFHTDCIQKHMKDNVSCPIDNTPWNLLKEFDSNNSNSMKHVVIPNTNSPNITSKYNGMSFNKSAPAALSVMKFTMWGDSPIINHAGGPTAIIGNTGATGNIAVIGNTGMIANTGTDNIGPAGPITISKGFMKGYAGNDQIKYLQSNDKTKYSITNVVPKIPVSTTDTNKDEIMDQIKYLQPNDKNIQDLLKALELNKKVDLNSLKN
jgi:hypothetical protein